LELMEPYAWAAAVLREHPVTETDCTGADCPAAVVHSLSVATPPVVDNTRMWLALGAVAKAIAAAVGRSVAVASSKSVRGDTC
jgi:hypothetical protein